jgi:uncharacterized coiled-coil protein SlyX
MSKKKNIVNKDIFTPCDQDGELPSNLQFYQLIDSVNGQTPPHFTAQTPTPNPPPQNTSSNTSNTSNTSCSISTNTVSETGPSDITDSCTLNSYEFDQNEIIKSLYKQVCVLQKHVIKQDRKLKFLCDRVVELECKSGHDGCEQGEPNEYHAQNFEAMLHLFNKKFNKLETSLNSLSNVVYRTHDRSPKVAVGSKNCKIVKK